MKNLLPILQKIETIHTLYIATFLFFLTFFVYVNTLGNGLFYDDEQFLYKNTFVQTFDVVQFFTKNVDAGAGVVSNYYRPLLLLTYGIEHLLVGNTPFLYHLTSLLFHAGAGILLYLLLVKLFQNKIIALLTSILFLIHPIQTEAVAYVSGRGDPMGMFFMLLSIYLSFTKSMKVKITSLIFFVCALLSKELTIITPVILFLCLFAVGKGFTKKNFVTSLTKSLPYIGINIFYIFLRLTILNFANTLNFYNGHNLYADNIFIRLLTFLSLLPHYIGLIIYPKTLFIDRSADIISSPTLLIGITFLSIIGIGLFSLYWRKYSLLPLFAFLFFFVAFIPTSGIIPINGIFFEHFIYYPSIGLFLFASYLFYLLLEKTAKPLQGIFLSLLCVCVVILCFRTIYRNAEWHDPITFYEQTIQHTKSARIYNNLAMSYADNNEEQKAVSMYQKSIQLADLYPQTHYNLANSYLNLGDSKSAEKEYQKSLGIDPYFYLAYFKLFSLYQSENNKAKQEEVITQVKQVVSKNPSFAPVLQQLEQAM